jgi:ribonuclease J
MQPNNNQPKKPVPAPGTQSGRPQPKQNQANPGQNQSQANRPAQPKPDNARQQNTNRQGKAGDRPRPQGRPGRGRGRTNSGPPIPPEVPINRSQFNSAVQPRTEKIANQAISRDRLRVMPLGGLGEIGKNMMAIEFGQDIIIIDMGFAFPTEFQPGIDYIIPDTTYLEQNKHKVRAIIVTHGHMDHIGGAGYIMPKFPVPVYGSRLSIAFVEKQISEFNISKPNLIVIDPDKHEKVQIGVFNIELVRVTHTISDSTAVVVRTPVGTVINTGDWRNDPEPLDNKLMDYPRFKEIAAEGVLLLMSDSTSCDRVGHNPSEKVVVPTIDDLFSRAKGRIMISAFSSSITRVQLVIDATARSGRKLALVGRSTLTNVELCVKYGYIKMPPNLFMRVQDIVNLPNDKVVILSTGSQGEENSALVRMSTGDHQNIKIKPGDTIILSSSVIPGNEKAVVQLVDNLMREGAQVYARMTEGIKKHGPVHVGGHGHREDVGDLVKLLKPKYYMPIHGEFHHLVYSAEVAVENGVPTSNCFVLDNGDVLELTASTATKAARIPSGSVLIDGSGVGDVEHVVLRDRLAMAAEGIFVIVATVERKTGKLIGSPDIISRGFIYMKENEELVARTRHEIRKVFDKRKAGNQTDWVKFKLKMRDDISDFLYKATKRNPMVITVVNEI